MRTTATLPPIDPLLALERRLAFRVHAYLTSNRRNDAEFTLQGLRGWMLSQTWPDDPARPSLVCLAVLSWNAICATDGERPDDDVRTELARQLDYLGGMSTRRPHSLSIVTSNRERVQAYRNLQTASKPGSAYRTESGMPRHNAQDKQP